MMNIETEVLVIGSGFGGSVVASRLAEAGKDVLVLERGPWRDTLPTQSAGIKDTHPLPQGSRKIRDIVRTIHGKMLPKNGLTLNRKGHLEIRNYKDVVTIAASGVGGGSHAYAGIIAKPADKNYWDGLANDVSQAVMDPHYERVTKELNPIRLASELQLDNFPPSKLFSNQAWFEPVNEEEHPSMAYLVPQTAGTEQPVTDVNGIVRKPTNFKGQDGMFGSPTGSKTSVDAVYLLPALKKGLRVLDMHEAIDVRKEGEVFYTQVKDHKTGQLLNVCSKRVVMAAGTLNTVTILFRSKAKGFKDLCPALGSGFGTNGDYAAIWDVAREDLDSVNGLNAHGLLKIKDAPSTYTMMLGAMEIPPVGPRLSKMMAKNIQSDRHKYMLIAMGPEQQQGNFSFQGGKLNVNYSPEQNPVFDDIRAGLDTISRHSGRPITPQMKKTATVHAFGGCRIGNSEEDGMVDGLGQVYQIPGLYVADASALPKSIGKPPSLSIAAWASHVASGILAAY